MKKKINKTEAENFSDKISKTLNISSDMFADIPHITINDNKDMRVENYKGVLSYDTEKISLGGKKYIIEICGRKLKIIMITDEDIWLSGVIGSVSFLPTKKE